MAKLRMIHHYELYLYSVSNGGATPYGDRIVLPRTMSRWAAKQRGIELTEALSTDDEVFFFRLVPIWQRDEK